MRKILITTIFKFGEVEGVLNSRDNIILMVDEAHRTQEGGLGEKMRTALPNAFFFGLTGTPINKLDKNTFRTFGSIDDATGYMSRYSFSDSIRDGATLPLNFEPVPVDLHVNQEVVNEAFDRLSREAGLTAEEKSDVAKRVRMEAIMKSPERIAKVCEIENSKVFHKPSCHLLLNTKEVILGTVKFSTVTLTGRMPCKICNPSKDDIPKPLDIQQIRNGAKKSRCTHRDYAVGEKRAIGRYKRAKQERDAALKNAANLTKQEREDIFTLTQPEFAFWAVKGYKTFHIRSCAKLTNMSNYQGFKYYDQAIRAGYIPCKTCKPTRKHDTKVSIPLGNKHRENDTIENLIHLCEKEGYSYTEEGLLFTIETPVGKWRIHTQVVPIKVEHQNIILDGKYHHQPRMFLSLFDTFFYIDRHDKTLMKKLAHAGTAE